MIPWISRLGIWGSFLLLLTASVATAAAPPVFRRAGIAIRPPLGWFVTTEPLNGITDPVQRFVVSSYRVPIGADAGGSYVPSSRGVVAQLTEEAPPINGGPWPPRRAHFTLPRLGRMETLDGNRWGELLFREHGRHFYIFIWVGRHATTTQVGLLLRALDGIQIRTP
jgi:hypothetical protein